MGGSWAGGKWTLGMKERCAGRRRGPAWRRLHEGREDRGGSVGSSRGQEQEARGQAGRVLV